MTEEERQEIYGDLLKLAAQLLRHNMPSRHYDEWGWPKGMQRTSWLKVHKAACDADEQARVWGVMVGEIADRIVKEEKESQRPCDCPLGNGDCEFFDMKNDCCLYGKI